MPMMDLTIPAGTLDDTARRQLVDDLTTVLLRAERAPDTEFFRSITWVFVHEPETTNVLTAGQPITQPLVRLMVTTPQGALSQRRRAELVAEATRVIREATGISEGDSLRIWVLCREIDEGSWGAGGQIIEFEQLRAAAAAQRQAEPASA